MAFKTRVVFFIVLFFLSVFPLSVFSEDDTGEDVFVAPRLSENAIPWDERHPELLDGDMLYARSAILIEASTGETIFAKNADEIMYPASTTKILTAYLALQMGDLNYDEITISQNAVDLVPPTYTRIPVSEGETVALRDLISATLVRSGNEGANALAEYFGGSIEGFASLMNDATRMLGCSSSTHFTNPSGVHDDNHYTTVRDMAIIARAAMANPDFAEIVQKNTYEMPASNKHPARQLVGQTSILDPQSDFFYSDCIGVKTGFTNRAGYCYVGAAERNGINLISVIFYSSRAGRWTDTKKLFEYGFTQIQSITPEALYADDPRVIEIAGFDLDDPQHGNLTLGIRATDETRDMKIIGRKALIDSLRENFSQISSVTWTREFRAPITIGETMGVLTFYSENKGTATYDLVATRSIAAREDAPPTLEQIEAYTLADENPFPRFSIDLIIPPAFVLLVLFFLLRALFRRWRKRTRKLKLMPPPKKRPFRQY